MSFAHPLAMRTTVTPGAGATAACWVCAGATGWARLAWRRFRRLRYQPFFDLRCLQLRQQRFGLGPEIAIRMFADEALREPHSARFSRRPGRDFVGIPFRHQLAADKTGLALDGDAQPFAAGPAGRVDRLIDRQLGDDLGIGPRVRRARSSIWSRRRRPRDTRHERRGRFKRGAGCGAAGWIGAPRSASRRDRGVSARRPWPAPGRRTRRWGTA